jgi:hypothetical protein
VWLPPLLGLCVAPCAALLGIPSRKRPPPRLLQLSGYLKSAFPRAKVVPRNGAIPATNCAYTYMCMEMAVDEEVGCAVGGGL